MSYSSEFSLHGDSMMQPRTLSIGSAYGGGAGSDVMQKLQEAQDKANAANQQRYTQGLSTLQTGNNQASGYLKDALAGTASLGQTQMRDIGIAQQKGLGSAAQSAVSRGLGNTTIADSLNQGVNRTADYARQNVAGWMNQARTGIQQQQAAQATGGAQNTANFIAARNDIPPSVGEYASLMQAANNRPAAPMMGGMPAPSQQYNGPTSQAPNYGQQTGSNFYSMASLLGNAPGGAGNTGTSPSIMNSITPPGGSPQSNLIWNGNMLSGGMQQQGNPMFWSNNQMLQSANAAGDDLYGEGE